MKQHTTEFKQELINMGKQIDSIITYEDNDETITLHEELYSVTPHYEANLLKSVMKQLDIESSVDVPRETIINYQLGVKIDDEYEYINYGNYVVYKSEKKEDTNTYLLTCYDKMLYAMKQNEDLGITYPITIQNYLNAVANKIGLQVATTNFYNKDQQIPAELYLGLDYTYRDILDEIAQATGSIILLNQNDEIELKYLNIIQDTINEEYLKDINVKFGEKYGPINSIVLSRAGGSDNVYLRDEQSVRENGLCEIKIIDNQIMNFNNRSDYLAGILNAIDGVEYYLNDFTSPGILYLECGDYYNIQVGENVYKCLMLNDEVNITQGIEEIIHTDLPEESETDYEKADKTDRKINQTYIIVDKQNQTIESVVNNVNIQNNKISQITQTVDELNTKIQDIADITIAGETMQAYLQLDGINESEPISVNIHPITTNISYLYPRDNLYPSDNLYMTNRKLRFIRTYDDEGETKTENIDYELPDDLLYYDSNNYDEFILSYDSQTCQIRKKCQYNSDGTVSLLQDEIVTDYDYPQILLGDGDYEIQILGYNIGYLAVRLMAQNIYTTQFATKAELSSSITQTANEINLRVDEKLDEEDFTSANIMLKINNDQSMATINADKINLNGAVTANENFKIKTDGSMEAVNATLSNGKITTPHFTVDNNGNTKIYATQSNTSAFVVKVDDSNRIQSYIQPGGAGFVGYQVGNKDYRIDIQAERDVSDISYVEIVDHNGKTDVQGAGIWTPQVIQTSQKKDKKNFELLQNGLDIIKSIDIYKYNLKTQNDNNKKHIGFVIGDNFKYSQEITSENNDGVDTYSFVSVCCKAIQEQQEQIEQLQKEIKELKGE